MSVVGAKPAPPLRGALQWTGGNQAEFVSFGGSGSSAVVKPDGSLQLNTSIGSAIVPVNGWALTPTSGRGSFPTQVDSQGGGSILALTDAEFQAQFTTADDWPSTY